MRGIAAFLVVLYHLLGANTLFKEVLAPENLSWSKALYFVPAYGYVGVFLFFVISGFCIHLRWAKAHSKGVESPEINFIAFWKRRWLRLYPAYLGAIVLFLWWQYSQGELVFNSLFVGDMITHLLMIHNLEGRFVYSMNGVFWTLAIEEQLYLIYFLLLWMRKKFGWKLTLIISFVTRFLWIGGIFLLNQVLNSGNFILFDRPIYVEIPIHEGALSNWWIWVLGAIAVENYLKIIKFPRWCYSLSLAFGFILIGAYIHYGDKSLHDNLMVNLSWLFEPFCWGVGFFFLLNWVMQYEGELKSPVIIKIVAFCAWVGLFSYSLYLTHEVVLRTFSALPTAIVVILTLIFAYVFYLIFEKPFMLYLSKKKAKKEIV